MKTIKAMRETDINVEGDKIVITQSSNYRTETIELPVAMWAYFSTLVECEMDNQKSQAEIDRDEWKHIAEQNAETIARLNERLKEYENEPTTTE